MEVVPIIAMLHFYVTQIFPHTLQISIFAVEVFILAAAFHFVCSLQELLPTLFQTHESIC
jgi:hypothetical protein